jgi:hypothetical protein
MADCPLTYEKGATTIEKTVTSTVRNTRSSARCPTRPPTCFAAPMPSSPSVHGSSDVVFVPDGPRNDLETLWKRSLLLLGEVITVPFVIGAALVIAGVWIGAIRRKQEAAEQTCPQAPSQAKC